MTEDEFQRYAMRAVLNWYLEVEPDRKLPQLSLLLTDEAMENRVCFDISDQIPFIERAWHFAVPEGNRVEFLHVMTDRMLQHFMAYMAMSELPSDDAIKQMFLDNLCVMRLTGQIPQVLEQLKTGPTTLVYALGDKDGNGERSWNQGAVRVFSYDHEDHERAVLAATQEAQHVDSRH